MSEIPNDDLVELRDNSYKLLKELVTHEGIYASAAIGWEGPYHAWFGRDSAITADFILAALQYGGDRELALTAVQAIARFAQWQGKRDTPETGEETGKIPHEIRTEFNSVDAVQHAVGTNMHRWYVDEEDHTLKNWDTADSTPLWTLAMLRSGDAFGEETLEDSRDHIRVALQWIVKTTEQYDGLVGFMGADLQPGRVYSGLHNQGWKDSEAVYQTAAGDNAPHPIKDVLVNAEAWAALCDGAAYFARAGNDPEFSQMLLDKAEILRQKFNSLHAGFILETQDGLAQAIDGSGQQLTQVSVDQGAVLWARTHDGRLVIDPAMVDQVARKMLSPIMFNPEAGVRDYAKGTIFTHGTNYHGSPNTYWPFMSGMVARGFEQLNRNDEAENIMKAFLNAVKELGTNIEMFIQDDADHFEPWSHPDPEIGQKSSREQAWTAAAVYYATSYLLKKNMPVSSECE